MEKNDRKLKIAKALLEDGKIESFMDLETTITISFIREAINKNYRPVKAKIFSPQKFTVENLADLAEALDCDPDLLWHLALKEHRDQKKKRADTKGKGEK